MQSLLQIFCLKGVGHVASQSDPLRVLISVMSASQQKSTIARKFFTKSAVFFPRDVFSRSRRSAAAASARSTAPWTWSARRLSPSSSSPSSRPNKCSKWKWPCWKNYKVCHIFNFWSKFLYLTANHDLLFLISYFLLTPSIVKRYKCPPMFTIANEAIFPRLVPHKSL